MLVSRAAPCGPFHKDWLSRSHASTARPDGKKWKLREFTRAHSQRLTTGYARLNAAEKAKLCVELAATRATKLKIVRANPKGVRKEVDAAFIEMKNEVCTRHSAEC